MIDAADLGAMSREQQLQRLVNHARREAARWEHTFAEDTPNAKAAEVLEKLRAAVGEDVMAYGYAMRRVLEGSGLDREDGCCLQRGFYDGAV